MKEKLQSLETASKKASNARKKRGALSQALENANRSPPKAWKPYPKYRDSGVEWLGEIPEHWERRPVKHLADFINGAAFKPTDWSTSGVPIIRIENLNAGSDFNFFEGEVSARYHVVKGDILFGWSGNRGTSFGPFIWANEGRYYLNQHIFKIARITEDRQWLYWALKAVTHYVEEKAHGIIGLVHITKGKLGNINIPVPGKDEQQSIARFLDAETGKIDRLIEKQEALLERLEEKRTALVTRAVTRGLDDSAPLKDSGVPWLGKIPEHWGVERNKALFRERDERTDTGEEELLTVSHITGVTRRADKDVYMFLAKSHEGYKRCRPGDLVINTMWAWMGALGVSAYEGIVSPSYNVYSFRGHSVANYYDALFRTPNFVKEIIRWSKGIWSSRLRLYPNEFLNIRVPVPPLVEQRAIAERLVEIKETTAEAERKIKALIAALKEKRTALISATVTGKIDVRAFKGGVRAKNWKEGPNGREVRTRGLNT